MVECIKVVSLYPKLIKMQNKVIHTTLKESKYHIKGVFTLRDKTKTQFEIDKHSGCWEQWGNIRENLTISVPKIEEIVYTFIYDYN